MYYIQRAIFRFIIRRRRRRIFQNEQHRRARLVDGEKAGGPAAWHEAETVESRAQTEQDMGVYQGPVAELAILSDVHMLGELRGGPVQVRAERQGGQAVGQVQAQREDELREVQQSHAVLLQDRRPVAGAGQTPRLQVRPEGHGVAHGQPKFQKVYILDRCRSIVGNIVIYLQWRGEHIM